MSTTRSFHLTVCMSIQEERNNLHHGGTEGSWPSCDFPRGDTKKGLFIPDTMILTNQRSDSTQVQLGELVSCCSSGAWLRKLCTSAYVTQKQVHHQESLTPALVAAHRHCITRVPPCYPILPVTSASPMTSCPWEVGQRGRWNFSGCVHSSFHREYWQLYYHN